MVPLLGPSWIIGDKILSPIVRFPLFIDEIKEHWRTVHVSFRWTFFNLRFEQQERSYLHFEFDPEPGEYAESAMQMSGAVSPKLISVEELRIFLAAKVVESGISWHKFYQYFPNVKVIQTENTDPSRLAGTLLQGVENHVDDLGFLPALEEIEVGPYKWGKHENQSESELAVFDPFISARQRVGRPVKVYFRP